MGELAEPWNTAAERAGIRQTLRGIADASGVSHVTVRRLVQQGRTSPATVEAVAAALRVDEVEVYEWAGIEVSDWGPWTPPAAAHRLSPRARDALAELILVLTQEDETNAESAAREKTDGDGGAPTSGSENVRPLTPRQQRALDQGQPVERAADSNSSEGRAIRNQMDQHDNDPDPDGPEFGA